MDFVWSYFGTNEPLTSWTLFSSLFDWFAVWPWSEVHLYRSNFIQNPYFSGRDVPNSKFLENNLVHMFEDVTNTSLLSLKKLLLMVCILFPKSFWLHEYLGLRYQFVYYVLSFYSPKSCFRILILISYL